MKQNNKHKYLKLFITVISALVLLFSVSISVSAASGGTRASGYCGSYLTWTLYYDGDLVINGSGSMTNWSSYSSVPWYYYRSSIKQVTVGDNVTSIGSYAFYSYYDNIESIDLGDKITSIGTYAFYGCDSITDIIIPDRVTSISSYAFNSCDNLASITIPVSVTSINNSAFNYCESLTTVYYDGTRSQWQSIYIGSSNSYLTSANIIYNTSYDSLTLNVTKTIYVTAYNLTYISFTPSVTASYTFYSTSNSDTYAYLYNSSFTQLKYDDDSGSYNNFSITYTLEAGKTYYFGCRYYSSGNSGSYDVKIICSSHVWNNGTVTTAATCTSSGVKTFTCTVCESTKTEYISSLGHNYSSSYTVDTAATCTTSGSKSKHCTRTGCTAKTSVTTIPATGHTPGDWITLTQATVGFEGTEVKRCTVCNTITSTRITPMYVEVNDIFRASPSGTNISFVAFIPTETGIYSFYSTSNSDTYGYLFNDSLNISGPISLSDPSVIEYDDDSGSSYNFRITRELQAGQKYYLGMSFYSASYSGTITATIKKCHNVTSWSTNSSSSCTESGSRTGTCTICGETVSETIPATNHSWNSGTITNSATCTSSGTKRYTCTVCGSTKTETISSLGHSYSSTYTVDSAATCTTAGSKSRHCTRTGCTAKTSVTSIPATGHNPGDWIIQTESGIGTTGTEIKRCRTCNNIVETRTTYAKIEVGSRFSVSVGYGSIVYLEFTPTVSGTYKFYSEGSYDTYGYVYNSSMSTVASDDDDGDNNNFLISYYFTAGRTYYLGCKFYNSGTSGSYYVNLVSAHSVTSWTTTNATCTSDGFRQGTCTICGQPVTEIIPATGHNYSSSWTVDTAATCTQSGSKSYHCTNSGCSAKNNITTVPATGHSWDSGTVITTATCTATGSKTYDCYNCSETKTEVIALIAHNYSSSWTTDIEPTCVQAGEKSHHCTRCGDKNSITAIAALGHNEYSIPGYAATCTQDGLSDTKICSICEITTVEQTVIPATGHSIQISNGFAATCTEKGLTEGKSCSVCNEIIEEQQLIDATGHTRVTISGIEATCTTDGYTDKIECSVCGHVIRESEILSKVECDYSQDSTITVNPTCTEDGTSSRYCKYCNSEQIEILSKTGHNPGDWQTETEPTCLQKGKKHQQCLNCNEILKTESIPKSEHVPGEWYTETEPQPGVEGIRLRNCTVCQQTCGGADIIPALPVEEPENPPVQEEPKEPENPIQPEIPLVLGDINNDSKVNAADARLALRFASKLDNAQGDMFTVSDVNKDEKITASDARTILRVSAKLEEL